MALAINSLIRRHMKDAESFRTGDATLSSHSVHLEEGESVIGVYVNPAPWDHVHVAFTTHAINVDGAEEYTRIPYDEIVDYELPASKADCTGVRIRTNDGIRFIRMAGRSGPGGQFGDAFALSGFLHAYLRATRGTK